MGLNNKEERILQKYSTIAHAIILFLFGLTLMTVSPVFAEDSPEFVACQQIKPAGDFNLMKQKKNCFRDLARSLQADSDMVSGGLGTPLDTVPADNLAIGGTIPCPACDLIGNTKP